MKINRFVPDYLQQYTDCFGVDREVPPVINLPRCIPTS